jgi:iron(III) transport system substrate-binding protein
MVGIRHRQRSRHRISRRFAPLAACAARSALAQGNRVAEIATYQGADREQRLIEGAKKEKELAFYSSVPPEDIAALISAFDKKYGVKVRVWRSDSEGILQRIISEAKARRFEVDIMAGSSSALEPLYRENLLQEVRSPYLADIIAEAIAPHRQWVSIYLSTFVQAYNTNLVRKDSLPRTYRTSSVRSGRAASPSRPRTSTGSRR